MRVEISRRADKDLLHLDVSTKRNATIFSRWPFSPLPLLSFTLLATQRVPAGKGNLCERDTKPDVFFVLKTVVLRSKSKTTAS